MKSLVACASEHFMQCLNGLSNPSLVGHASQGFRK